MNITYAQRRHQEQKKIRNKFLFRIFCAIFTHIFLELLVDINIFQINHIYNYKINIFTKRICDEEENRRYK